MRHTNGCPNEPSSLGLLGSEDEQSSALMGSEAKLLEIWSASEAFMLMSIIGSSTSTLSLKLISEEQARKNFSADRSRGLGGMRELPIEQYERYKIDGIVVGENISLVNLKSTIAAELNVDESIVCVEGGKRDTKALSIVESKICDSYYIPEMEVKNYISDTNVSNVEVKQLYKDKATLMAVMEKYKIKHSFNFRVKRSDSKSYVLVCHSDACCWELKESVRKNTDIFKLRYFNSEHTCPLRDQVLSKVQATVGFLSGVTAPKPVVVVDASHLSGSYRGTFVSASTLDGADRNESILKSVSIVYPNVPHFACIWHLWKNVCTYYKRSRTILSDIFYSMAKAYRKDDFEKLMAKVEKIDGRVKKYLQDAGYERWARSHATVNRGRMMTSNIAECINGCLVDARQLPIIDFLEEVVASSEYIFTVYEGAIRYIVCLERKTCSCGRFQHDEIPCAHAMTVLKKKYIKDVHPYCSDYYKHDALTNTYALPIEPMPDKSDWIAPESVLEEVVLPPRYKKMPGRPRKKRKKNPDEKITTNTNCCGQEGHNRRTCTFFPKDS
ncbi:uncharacterized protein [Solanum tuberosum]|uniref:uncharacterized protein n=1 Tax=Solanum tuberosum TaxID=4113 RepID=UPI00073A422E|nr:PREDICTED: uncharacterized protein LOC107060404 [Solanum tuberosum]